ncbi:MAG: hypothetical protein ACRD0A_04745 [Acidimicrobiales bacterium]
MLVWEEIDWAAVHDVNQRVCKDASSRDRLAFRSLFHHVLIGPDVHPEDLVDAVANHPASTFGTVRDRSARVGAGSMEIEDCPPDHQEGFEWAIAQFSKKIVEFIGSAGRVVQPWPAIAVYGATAAAEIDVVRSWD